MRPLYPSEETARLTKRKKIGILCLSIFGILLLCSAVLFVLLANRKNVVLMEILAVIVTFLLLSGILYASIELLGHSISLLKWQEGLEASSPMVRFGPFSLTGETRYEKGIRMLGVRVEDGSSPVVVFLEEGRVEKMDRVKAVTVKRNIIVAVEESEE